MKKYLQPEKLLCLFALIALCTFCTACSKDDSISGNGKAIANLPGTIYWYFAGDVGYMNFATGKGNKKMMLMGAGSSRIDAFDISWDNKKILLTMDVEGTYNFDERRFVLRNNTENITYKDLSDGQNLRDFTYEWGGINATYAYISPNEKYLALEAQHFSDMPLTILNAETGALVSNWIVEGVSFLKYGSPVWTADNTVYFRIANSIYKCSPSNGYKSAPRVLSFDKAINQVTVNPQGTKFVFRMDKHLWMCNIDGSDLRQITTSRTMDFVDWDGERMGAFSPDGKYIALTADTRAGMPWSDHNYPDGSWVSVTGGKYGYIAIIPADGNVYDFDKKDNGIIWLTEPGSESRGIACNTYLAWR